MGHKGQKRSAVWIYYSKLSDTEARCKLCNSNYSFAKGSTSNLHKHLRLKHKSDIFEGVKQEPNPSDDSDSNLEEKEIQPKFKGKRKRNDIDIEECKLELLASEEGESTSHELSNRTIWNYFVKVSSAEARCNICHTIYSFQDDTTNNLTKHLQTKHKNIDSGYKSDATDPFADTRPVDEEILVVKGVSPRNWTSNQTKSRKSIIWEHFLQVSKEKVKCNICQSIYSYKGGSTSNLLKHLRMHEGKTDASKTTDIANFLNNFDLVEGKSTDESEPDNVEPVVMTPIIQMEKNVSSKNSKSRSLSKPKLRKLDDLLLNLVVRDLQSFSMLRDEGFSELMEVLEPSYKLPSSDLGLTSLLNDRYEQATNVLKKLLAEATDVTITTDTWKSSESSNYLAMSVHFITKKWKLLSCFLDCVTYEEHDTGINLSKSLQKIAADWGINEKVHIAVTENAPNVVSAVQMNQWPHLHCFAHTLNLIVQHGLSTFTDIHKKVKLIVEYFQRNPKANATFLDTQIQIDSECTAVKLKNDDPAVWNTTFSMFEQLIKLEKALTLTFGFVNNPPQLLNEDEFKILKEIYRILSPFEQITQEMAAEETISVSKIIIVVRGLTSVLNKFSAEIETETAQHLIKDLQDSIAELLPNVEYDSYLAKASLLDPRFSRLAFTMDDAFKVAKADLEVEARMRVGEYSNKDDHKSDNKHSSEEQSLIWQEFDSSIKSSIQSNPEEIANAEIRLYLEEPIIDRKSNSLLWWKNKADLYPTLSSLAKKHLCAVGTSVNCKVIFSQTGRIFNERRSRLEDMYVSKILFLHFNEFLSKM